METTSPRTIVERLNRTIHDPVRLAALTVLASLKEADFKFLLTALGVTKGNLSTHMDKLASAGYVKVAKEFLGKIPHTVYSLTPVGRTALNRYWAEMNAISPPTVRSRWARRKET